ncbi:MAG: sigma-54 interaction domain-containing protein [Planctomycetota bacterium]|jgi:DNA-binding NtrC family response regulator
MPTLRFFSGDEPRGEFEFDGDFVAIGNREGDTVRLSDLGIAGGPNAGGTVERRDEGWVFLPRSGRGHAAPIPLDDGHRVDLGRGAFALGGSPGAETLAIDSIPEDEAEPVPMATVAPPGKPHEPRLRLLARFVQGLEEGRTSEEVLAGALDSAFGIVHAERGMAAVLDEDGRGLRVVAARNLGSDDPRKALSRRVLKAVLTDGQDVFTGDAARDVPSESVSMMSIRAICALPLKVRGRVAGVLYVDRGLTMVPFVKDDFAFLQILSALVGRHLEMEKRVLEAESERRRLAERLAQHEADSETDLAWVSPAMQAVRESAKRLLPAWRGRNLPVLVTGESGTGKEVLAQWLHDHVERDSGPFVVVNCAAIPQELAESELFGIEKGVATGVVRRIGKIQQAHGGTLFLDEIGEMDASIQAKLLRALESRRIVRVGGQDETPVKVRIISATNTDLTEAIREGRFREDLYWRLCGVEMRMPPLRDRREDILPLARAFSAKFADELGLPPPRIEDEAGRCLLGYSWPGNVRELRQRMGALTALAAGGAIRAEDLPTELRSPVPESEAPSAGRAGLSSLADVEMDHIRSVLRAVGGDRARAAAILGIHKKTLARKLAMAANDGDD